jgi:large subunit ribosomal protein L15
MPIYRRLPKRGFTPLTGKKNICCLNLLDLQRLAEAGKLKSGEHVTLDALKACGAVRDTAEVVRVLGKGRLSTALTVVADYVTPSAMKAIKKAGGETLSARTEA